MIHSRQKKTGARLLTGISSALLVIAAIPAQADESNGSAFSQAKFRGYTTGTVVYADLIESSLDANPTRLFKNSAALSGAQVDSRDLPSENVPGQHPDGQLSNEMGIVVQPSSVLGSKSFGRGSAMEVGISQAGSGENRLVQAGHAQAVGPPDSGLKKDEIKLFDQDPVVFASLLGATAEARWRNDKCIVGKPFGSGVAHTAGLEILDTDAGAGGERLESPVLATYTSNPDRAVVQARSQTKLVLQTDEAGERVGSRFGLMSETRETFAPITLFKDTPNAVTIELLGEWVFQAVATGVPGAAYIQYGPSSADSESSVLRIYRGDSPGPNNENVIFQLTAQQFFASKGVSMATPAGEMIIGEDPRDIGEEANSRPIESLDGTIARGAVDVIRARLLEAPGQMLGEFRVGHFEAMAQVPSGGIECPGISVTKTANPESVRPGDEFVFEIAIRNDLDSVAEVVKVVEKISVERGVRYRVLAHDPPADSITSLGPQNEVTTRMVWENIGPIRPGETRVLRIRVKVEPASGNGAITGEVEVQTLAEVEAAQAETRAQVPLRTQSETQVLSAQTHLAATGTPRWVTLLGFILLGSGIVLVTNLRREPTY